MLNIVFAVAVLLFGLTGCSTKVTRTELNKPIDLSGQWNDTDSRLVAEEMIEDALNRPWLAQFNKEEGGDPVVIVGTILNRSHEHINTQVFTKDLEQALLNSGRIQFVANKDERREIREERTAQNEEGYTDPDSVSEMARELGADFMLQGSVNSIKDELGRKYVILYQVNLELIDLTTNQKKWIGQKEIKKQVNKRAFKLF